MIAKPIEWIHGAEGHAWTDEFPKLVNVRYQISPTGFDGFKAIKFGAWVSVFGKMEKIGDYDSFSDAQAYAQRHYDELLASLLSDDMLMSAFFGWDRVPDGGVNYHIAGRLARIYEQRFIKR